MLDVKHCTLDIETLGKLPGSAVVAIGCRTFDRDGLHAGFETFISVASARDYGKEDVDTMNWWATQDIEVRNRVMGGRISTDVALNGLIQFVEQHQPQYVWANSPSFDIVMLQPIFNRVGLVWPFSFRQERDSRTLRALAPMMGLDLSANKKDQKAHMPLDDATTDARSIRQILLELERLVRVDQAPPREVFSHPDAPAQVSTLAAHGGLDL